MDNEKINMLMMRYSFLYTYERDRVRSIKEMEYIKALLEAEGYKPVKNMATLYHIGDE